MEYESSRDSDYRLGLVSVSFRPNSPQEILEAMKKADLFCIEWGSDIHAPCNDIEKLREIARLQKEYGVSCSSYGTYFRLGVSPIEELIRYIEAAKILGTHILRIWCGAKSGACFTEDEKNALMSQCKQANDIAKQHGVILCLECHCGTYTERSSDTLSLIKEISSPCFQMYWQPFQWQTENDNLMYAEAIASVVHNIHVFQWKGERRFSLNDGIQEWQNYLSKFPAPRTLLLEFMPDNNILSLKTEADALRKIIGD